VRAPTPFTRFAPSRCIPVSWPAPSTSGTDLVPRTGGGAILHGCGNTWGCGWDDGTDGRGVDVM